MKKAAIGAGGGAAIGFFAGGPVGAGIGAFIGLLGGMRLEQENPMTPDRKAVFEEALKSLKGPLELRKLADEFENQGMPTEANMLRKRAALRELPAEKKAQRKQAFRTAMKVGKDGAVVTEEQITNLEKMAAVFQEQGATGNAAALRQHAAALRKLHSNKLVKTA